MQPDERGALLLSAVSRLKILAPRVTDERTSDEDTEAVGSGERG